MENRRAFPHNRPFFYGQFDRSQNNSTAQIETQWPSWIEHLSIAVVIAQPFLSALCGAWRFERKRAYCRSELANGKNPVTRLALVSIEVAPALVKPTVIEEVRLYVALELI